MKSRHTVSPEGGRDYRTLLEMGWTPDSLSEAVEIAAELLRDGDPDAALAAVESARRIAKSGVTTETEFVALESLAFEVAVRRSDAPRAIAAANAIRLGPVSLSAAELDRLRGELHASAGFRPELREALGRVLDAVQTGDAAGGLAGESAVALDAAAMDDGDDDLPYLFPDPDSLLEPAGWDRTVVEEFETAPVDPEWLSLAEPATPEGAAWSFGAFAVHEGESLADVRLRFMEAAALAAPDHARDACETGWSFFLMEDFAAAAVLFDQSLGDPAVRVAAAEGLVRCRLNLSQPAEAVAFLERLQAVCFSDGLPEPLRYWYGRATEAGGEVRKARIAYRSVSAGAFPDVPGRLAALP